MHVHEMTAFARQHRSQRKLKNNESVTGLVKSGLLNAGFEDVQPKPDVANEWRPNVYVLCTEKKLVLVFFITIICQFVDEAQTSLISSKTNRPDHRLFRIFLNLSGGTSRLLDYREAWSKKSCTYLVAAGIGRRELDIIFIVQRSTFI